MSAGRSYMSYPWSCGAARHERALVGGATAKLLELHLNVLHTHTTSDRPSELYTIHLAAADQVLWHCCQLLRPGHIFVGAMHEIVTLQFGSQSNYLGTHFWNTQVSSCACLTSLSVYQVYLNLLGLCSIYGDAPLWMPCTHFASPWFVYEATLTLY